MSLKSKKFVTALMASLVLSATLTACSDDKPAKSSGVSFDHKHGAEVTDMVKHKFEHQFAEQCIQRELKNSVNKQSVRSRFAKPCMCIAKRVLKDLTAVQAEKFVNEKKHTHTMKMNFDEAAYFCLQEKAATKAKSPVLFGKK